MLTETKENTKKAAKPKCPPKISLIATKKAKNKENLPLWFEHQDTQKTVILQKNNFINAK